MCDYSQEGLLSRPAEKGDELRLKRLDGAADSAGFVSSDDPDKLVCLLPGTKLSIRHMNLNDQIAFNVRTGAEVMFVERSLPQGVRDHRDAIKFPGRREPVLLKSLKNGFAVGVLMLPHMEEEAPPAFSDGITIPVVSDPAPKLQEEEVLVLA